MPPQRETRSRGRSTVDWSGASEALMADFERFGGRARGARIRYLAMLGFLAEQRGLSLSPDGAALQGLSLIPTAALLPVLAPAPAQVSVPVATSGDVPVALSEGLERLAANFGGGSFGF